ncbi:MAG: DUF4384 domain-containing protein [Trichodesmium sp. St18_bin1]|jgi:hypothetical protein|nr:DUF4384 domain-containing protein [Trichodesmium sp. St18_bin1]MDE5119681.1 DUF4384 domain-containing protein [Trichodesmium sp. St19_bin1]
MEEENLMMIEESYKDNEAGFLEKIADKLMFKDKTRLVFTERFKIDNDDLNNQKLSDVLSHNLLQNTSKKSASDIIMRDSLRTIFRKLEVEGCDFNGATRDKVKIAKRWLREIVYPWQILKNMATSTNKMGPVIGIPEVGGSGMHKVDFNYPSTVHLGSEIKFEVRLERPGYLTLLEKNTSGQFYCLYPSFLGTLPVFDAGVVSLPMEGAPVNYFTLTGKLGIEEIIAAIAPERPKLDWLPEGNQPPLLLEGKHLQEFLRYFRGEPNSTLWYMNYKVV